MRIPSRGKEIALHWAIVVIFIATLWGTTCFPMPTMTVALHQEERSRMLEPNGEIIWEYEWGADGTMHILARNGQYLEEMYMRKEALGYNPVALDVIKQPEVGVSIIWTHSANSKIDVYDNFGFLVVADGIEATGATCEIIIDTYAPSDFVDLFDYDDESGHIKKQYTVDSVAMENQVYTFLRPEFADDYTTINLEINALLSDKLTYDAVVTFYDKYDNVVETIDYHHQARI